MKTMISLVTISALFLTTTAVVVEPFAMAVQSFAEQNSGKFCWKNSFGRGVGTIPTDCGDKENQAGLCYNRCRSGYYGVGPVCWQSCRGGFSDHGASCYKNLFNWYFKGSYGRGVGTVPNQCGSNQNYDAGLCYPACKTGYYGVGPVCWRRCEGSTPTDCGAGCASSTNACTSKVMEQVVSVLQLAENIVEFVATLGGAAAVKASVQTAMKALYQTARGAFLKGASKEVFVALMRKLAVKAGQNFSQAAVETAYVKASANAGFKWEDFAALDPTGIADVVLAFMAEVC